MESKKLESPAQCKKCLLLEHGFQFHPTKLGIIIREFKVPKISHDPERNSTHQCIWKGTSHIRLPKSPRIGVCRTPSYQGEIDLLPLCLVVSIISESSKEDTLFFFFFVNQTFEREGKDKKGRYIAYSRSLTFSQTLHLGIYIPLRSRLPSASLTTLYPNFNSVTCSHLTERHS